MCTERLRTVHINTKRYMKMEQKPQYEEQAKWKDEENCELTFTENRSLKSDKGAVLGESVQTVVTKAKRSDMEFNLAIKIDDINKKQDQAIKLRQKLAQVGKKPAMTGEIARIKRAIADIGLIEEIAKMEYQLGQIDDAIKEMRGFIQIREKTLSTGPKE